MADKEINYHQFLRSRRSVRRFLALKVEDEKLSRILETALFAPSAHNRQPWRFAIVTSEGVKTLLAKSLSGDFYADLIRDGVDKKVVENRVNLAIKRMIGTPVIIILCLDMSEMNKFDQNHQKEGEFEFLMGVQSVAAAGLQILLAAHAEGLSGFWSCSALFSQKTIIVTLSLPDSWQPQAILHLGYPAISPKLKSLKSPNEITRYF